MDMLSFFSVPLLLLTVICILLFLQRLAIKNGRLVKAEYSKPKRLFWAVLIASIVACNSITLGNYYFIVLAVAIGVYLYFFKQYYAFKGKED